ncbi:DUF7133 domain-containing protein [Spongiimicrobium salis]|uniref:DUF7133 domain-containing protein n=1 Tax=Spongiimicrobium salis TaxID=1667022 RepID=UPI00374D0632
MKLASLLFFLLMVFSCAREAAFEETPVSFDQYTVEPGFEIQALAAEPLIEAPINISFDNQGRLWVLEMQGYMRSIEGIDEEAPIGRILILEDLDKDGQMDHSKVFLGHLKLARAFAHVYNGLLYAEPPYLYYTEIKSDDTPGNTIVVDSTYAVGGNAEHQPNGLVMGMDNWIYSAKSNKRYRMQHGIWKTSITSARGQWGITQDRIGRLIYNNNSNQAQGDWTFPNILNSNASFKPKIGINNPLIADQRVYPKHVTVVNRGYLPHMLHPDGKLKNFTSACGPLYYEGDLLPEAYQGNLFVCAPEANLIKRNILEHGQLRMTGKQAWEGKELLSATDEGFRPVNLQNGPDGGLYIVDMHRGIIQHKTYMTSYLRKLYLDRQLDTIKGMGRILKLTTIGANSNNPIHLAELGPEQWVDSLQSKNIWIRQRSQQLIINSGRTQFKTALENLLGTAPDEVSRIHALYSLEGLNLLTNQHLSLKDWGAYPALGAHIIKLAIQQGHVFPNESLQNILDYRQEQLDYHLAFYLSKTINRTTLPFLQELLNRYEGEAWFLEPIYAGISEKQNVFLEGILGFKEVKDRIRTMQTEKISPNKSMGYSDGLTRGVQLYRKHCATCHGPDGDGIKGLAPPLLQSEYVSGSTSRLASILFYGLTGPIKVNGTSYDFQAAMPGIGGNQGISDEEIKDIGNYIRNAFTTAPQSLTVKTIDSLRHSTRPLDQMYTSKELHEKY